MGRFFTLFFTLAISMSLYADKNHLTHEQFLNKAFTDNRPIAKIFWLKPEHKNQAEKIMHRRINMLRVRYWQAGEKTAWILDEIGKEKPITIGVVISNNAIVSVDILAFRESRGWEIRYPFFTAQFSGLQLVDSARLNKPIDGITGATLSVSAVQRCATLALYLSEQLLAQNHPAKS